MPNFVKNQDIWAKAKEAARKTTKETKDDFYAVVAGIYRRLGGEFEVAATDGADYADVVRCSTKTGHTTLNEEGMKIHRAAQRQVEGDERFNVPSPTSDYMNGRSSYRPRPYIVDVLTPDGKGRHHAVINTADGRTVKHPFTWDADSGECELASGDPKDTERSTVYSSCASTLDVIRAMSGEMDDACRARVEASMPWILEEEPVEASGNSEGAKKGWEKRSTDAFGASLNAVHKTNDLHRLKKSSERLAAHKEAMEAHKSAAELHRGAIKGSDDHYAAVHQKQVEYHEEKIRSHENGAKSEIKASEPSDADLDPVEATWSDAARQSAIASKHKHLEGLSFAKAHEKMLSAGFKNQGGSTSPGNSSRVYSNHRNETLKLHVKDGMVHKVSAVDASEIDDPVECKDSGVPITAVEGKKWKLGQPVEFQWMPGGKSVVTASWRGRSVEMNVTCTKEDAKAVQASFAEHVAASPRRVPFGCVEHREEEKAFEPVRFSWKESPEPGIFCTCKPTKLGEENVNGRIHTSFSPSFLPDAQFAKAVCDACDTCPDDCTCGGKGVLRFPAGVRGSATNPAKVLAVSRKSVGSLTNWPAFKDILPVDAKGADDSAEKGFATTKGKDQPDPGKVITIESIFAKRDAARQIVVKATGKTKPTLQSIFAGQNPAAANPAP